MPTVGENAVEILALARQLLEEAKTKGDAAIIKSRSRQVRYWQKFVNELYARA